MASDPDRVVRFNQFVRAAGDGEFFDGRRWPPHFFVIGSERDQNWYFLDLSGSSEVVHLFHHEEGEIRRAADSLAEFPQALVEWWEDIARDESGR